jgi:hypothetical protein
MAYNPGANVNKAYEEYLKALQAKPAAYQAPAPYAPSQAVQGYLGDVNALMDSKPGQYQSQYQPQIQGIYDQIMERGPFKYDLNADALYQQYKDRYTQQANMGMKDAMGQAAALAGGYGNTYAQTVGQQTYDKTMQGLNDIIPALEDRAYGRWQGEGAELYNKLGAGQSMDETAYGRYRDAANDWRADYGMAQDLYANERAFDYGQFQDTRNFDYGAYRDMMGDYFANRDFAANQYGQERSFDYQTQYDAAQQAFQQAQFEWQKAIDARDFAAAEAWKAKQFEAEQAMFAAQQAMAQAEFQYQKERDAQDQSNWEAELAYKQQLDAQDQSNWETQWNYGVAQDQAALAAQQAAAAPASTSSSGKTQFNSNTLAAAKSAVSSGGNAGLLAYIKGRMANGLSENAGYDLYNRFKVTETPDVTDDKDKKGRGQARIY